MPMRAGSDLLQEWLQRWILCTENDYIYLSGDSVGGGHESHGHRGESEKKKNRREHLSLLDLADKEMSTSWVFWE